MIIATLLLSSLTLANAGHDHIVMNKSDYTNINTWNTVPEIVLCKSQSVFDVDDIRQAVTMWGRSIKKISTKESCNYDIERGKIKIIDDVYISTRAHYGETDYTFYRQTNRRGQEYKVYTGAIVQLDKDVSDIDLLVHEIGHAFGYGHYDRKTDVMNSVKYY